MRRIGHLDGSGLRGIALAIILGAMSLSAGPSRAAGALDVQVSLAPAMEAKSSEIGRRDLQDLKSELAAVINLALQRSNGGKLQAVRVEVVLEDARPNRPTMARLGREPSLSIRSLSLGGARVTGRVTSADGSTHAFDLERYSTDLRDDMGATTWMDAERAFDEVADDLVHGRLRNR